MSILEILILITYIYFVYRTIVNYGEYDNDINISVLISLTITLIIYYSDSLSKPLW